MLRNICTITTFHTPIDNLGETERRESSIISMIEDYFANSGMKYDKEIGTIIDYERIIYSLENVALNIFIKEDAKMHDYYAPHFIIEINMNDVFFEKSVIEEFINTITRFFSGMYIGEYFLEYDQIYNLEKMNSGKKYDIKDIKDINLESLQSQENKNLLDCILFLHYTLQKQIYSIGVGTQELANFLMHQDSPESIKDTLSVSELRMNEAEKSLIKNISILHKQIQIILSYFLKI